MLIKGFLKNVYIQLRIIMRGFGVSRPCILVVRVQANIYNYSHCRHCIHRHHHFLFSDYFRMYIKVSDKYRLMYQEIVREIYRNDRDRQAER